jgi:hypothetical protein
MASRKLLRLVAAALALVGASAFDPCSQAYISELMGDPFTSEEKAADGSIDLESSDLEFSSCMFMHDGSDLQVVGVQIAGVMIPKNARIISAQLIFEVEDTDKDSSALTVEIRAERSGLTAFFTSKAYDVSSRPATGSFARWLPPAGLEEKDLTYTPDLSAIVQEVVDLSTWDYGHAITFIFRHISGTGIRKYESTSGLEIDGVDYEGPALKLTWADPTQCALPPRPPSFPQAPAAPPALPLPPFPPAVPPGPCLPMAATGDGGSYQLGLDQPRTSLSANNFGGRGPQLNDPPYVQFNNVGILGGTYISTCESRI